MRGIVVLVVCVAVTIGEPMPSNSQVLHSPEGFIIGGHPTTIDHHPWQVSLQAYGFHYCGGSIISANIILTAAHCASYSVDLIKVRAGTSNWTSGGSVHAVEKLVRHEGFETSREGVPRNDIAVLVLKSPIVSSSRARAIPLLELDEAVPQGTRATLTGWGSLMENGDKSVVLRTVDVAIVAREDCARAYEDWGGVPDGQICAAHPAGGKDTCQGDSGGPLVVAGRQAGIVSWGNGCARKGYPGVYTEVGFFRRWIAEHAGV